MTKRPLLILLAFLAVSSIQAALSIGDIPLTRIILPAYPPDSVRRAAIDLQDFLERVAEVRLDITQEAAEDGNIFLGDRPELTDGLPPEGFRIVARGGNLYIAGRDQREVVYGIRDPWLRYEVYNESLKVGAFGEAGTLYGVYHFLEKYAGVRFYWPGELGTVVPRKSIVLPDGLDEQDAPEFPQRHPLFCHFDQAPEDSLWYRRVGFGAIAPLQIIHFFSYFVHAFKDTHPEFLALRNGERDSTDKCAIGGGGHLCLNAPGIKEAIAGLIKNYFRAHPEQSCFPLMPEDGLNNCCECPACRAEQDLDRAASGRFSNHIWKFLNDVAAIVAEEFPDRQIGCLAYEGYLAPPDRIEKLHPNVVLMFCKNRGSMASPTYSRAMHERIEAWLGKTDNRIGNWDYYLYAWMPWRGLPVFFPETIREDIGYMHEHHFLGDFICSESWMSSSDAVGRKINYPATQHLNLYLTAKLLWHHDCDVEALMDEYYRLFYGPAADPMRRFFTLAAQCWTDAFQKDDSRDGIFPSIAPKDVFSLASLDAFQACLDEAAALAPAGSPYAGRIALLASEYVHGRASLVTMIRNEKPELAVLRLRDGETVTVDGVLDESTWKDGQCQGMVSKNGEATPFRAQIFARHDGTNLYLGVVMAEKKTDSLMLRGNRRDDPNMYLDDCLEFFLMDQDDSGNGRQFILNAAGQIWDGLRFSDGAVDAAAWSPAGACAAAAISDGKRIVIEFSCPLADLGLKPGDRATANFYRSRVVDEGQRFAVWSPTFAEGHFVPERFGFLKLAE